MAEESTTTQYVKMVRPQADATYGKMRPGQVLCVDTDRADRWIAAGLAEPSDEAAHTAWKDERAERIESREGAYSALNREGSGSMALWDVSTHRDALSAPEAGLRAAREAGVPLVNLGRLRNMDGLPIDPDASIEDILEARANLHPDVLDPLTAHEQASTSGGGSHYSTPMPLNPAARAVEQTIRDNERNAQSDAYHAQQAANGEPAEGEEAATPASRAREAAQRNQAARQQARQTQRTEAAQAQQAEPKT